MVERHLTVVLPAYNEAHKISGDLKRWCDFLATQPYSSEVWAVDDGSSDATCETMLAFGRQWKNPRVAFHHDSYAPNRGKGFALKTGVLKSRGRHVAFADVGLCVPPETVTRALYVLETNDIALASRRHPDSKVVRRNSLYRQLGSRVFRFLMGKTFGVEQSDTQCGFKAYRGSVARRLFTELKTDGFMFDMELLLRARRLGFRIGEFAVDWKTDPDTRYRVWSGSLRNIRELFRIWRECQNE